MKLVDVIAVDVIAVDVIAVDVIAGGDSGVVEVVKVEVVVMVETAMVVMWLW